MRIELKPKSDNDIFFKNRIGFRVKFCVKFLSRLDSKNLLVIAALSRALQTFFRHGPILVSLFFRGPQYKTKIGKIQMLLVYHK